MANATDLLLSLAAAPCDGAYAVMVGQLELLYVLSLRCFAPQRKESAACDAADRLPAVRQFMLDTLACGFTVREIAAQFYIAARRLSPCAECPNGIVFCPLRTWKNRRLRCMLTVER